MLLTTPARSTPHALSVMAPEPHMPPRQVLSEADLASRWGMSGEPSTVIFGLIGPTWGGSQKRAL